MIGDFFINIAVWFANTIVSWFPVSTGFPTPVIDAFSTLGGYVDILTPLIPMNTLLITVSLAISVEIAIFGFKTIKWLLSHIPVFGGKGV